MVPGEDNSVQLCLYVYNETYMCTMKPILRDLPLCTWNTNIFSHRRTYISAQMKLAANPTCLQRPHCFLANGVVFQDRLYIIYTYIFFAMLCLICIFMFVIPSDQPGLLLMPDIAQKFTRYSLAASRTMNPDFRP